MFGGWELPASRGSGGFLRWPAVLLPSPPAPPAQLPLGLTAEVPPGLKQRKVLDLFRGQRALGEPCGFPPAQPSKTRATSWGALCTPVPGKAASSCLLERAEKARAACTAFRKGRASSPEHSGSVSARLAIDEPRVSGTCQCLQPEGPPGADPSSRPCPRPWLGFVLRVVSCEPVTG